MHRLPLNYVALTHSKHRVGRWWWEEEDGGGVVEREGGTRIKGIAFTQEPRDVVPREVKVHLDARQWSGSTPLSRGARWTPPPPPQAPSPGSPVALLASLGCIPPR